jgi:hypothetical protein
MNGVLGSVISVLGDGNGIIGAPPASNNLEGEIDDPEAPASMPSAPVGGAAR